MIVEDDSDAAFRRILGIEVAQQPNEFNTAVAILYARRDMTILEIQRRQDGASAESLVFVIAADFGMLAWYGRQIGCGIADGLDSGLLIHRNGDHVGGRLASGSSCILQRPLLFKYQPVVLKGSDRFERMHEAYAFRLIRKQYRAFDVKILHLEQYVAVNFQEIRQRSVKPEKTQGVLDDRVGVKPGMNLHLGGVLLPAKVLIDCRPEL